MVKVLFLYGMDKSRKKVSVITPVVIWLTIVAGITSCANPSREISAEEGNEPAETRSSIPVHPGEVETVTVIYGQEPPVEIRFSETNIEELAQKISTLQYDTVWNTGEIMVKMTVPDYTLILNYKNRLPEEGDWLMLWKESGRAKFRGLWYFLPEAERAITYTLIEGYRSIVN